MWLSALKNEIKNIITLFFKIVRWAILQIFIEDYLKKKNTTNKVTMHGRSLASTIETMEALGPVGKEVLKKYGIYW